MNVQIKKDSDKVEVKSPYNPNFPGEAKKLGGRFDRETGVWRFDARDEERVRELCREVYGTDGEDSDLVSLRVRLDDTIGARRDGLYLAGRQIARAFGRDSGAKLGQGVVVLEGKGFDSGGSVKNWETLGRAGTVFELRDVPRPAAEKAVQEEHGRDMQLEILDESQCIDREALRAERQRLAARIEEIDRLLEE